MGEWKEGLDVDLRSFDGGAAGDGSADGSGQQGETQSVPAATRQGEEAPVKGASAGGQDGSSDAGSEKRAETPKERQARYRALVSGEFKDLFTADTQRIIDQRFKETRRLQETLEAQRPVMERLASRYGLESPDSQALTAAMDSEESLARERRERERLQRLDRWEREAEELREEYPDFALDRELEDPRFAAVLEGGAPVRLAYEAAHLSDIKEAVARQAALERERAITAHIRARGTRPVENGAAAQTAVTSKVDPDKMTREERAEVARRAMRGEKITFR